MDRLRSLLFVPGVRPDMLQKAPNYPVDALVPDMEDSVPVEEKDRARETVARMLPQLAAGGLPVIPRTNSLGTGLLPADAAAVVGPHIAAVTVGKIGSAWEVVQVCAVLDGLERAAGRPVGSTRLLPWIETAQGVANAAEICRASPRIAAVCFGADDYTADMGVPRSADGVELLHPRSVVAVAARAAGIPALDTPYTDFRDAEGLRREAALARQMGYRGKFAIHPGQIEAINATFAPSPEEVEEARRIVSAYEAARALGHGATSLDGRMIDAPVVQRARNVLALAETVRS